jgi:2-phosphosulfolactate phosphatase
MLSSSGTKLMLEASQSAHGAYVGCFCNYGAIARHLIGRHPKVAVIGAGSHDEFREEDQMCCAWVAEALVKAGYRAANSGTVDMIERWSGTPPIACAAGNSVAYLRRSAQMRDFEFITARVNDVEVPAQIHGNEVVAVEIRVLRPVDTSMAESLPGRLVTGEADSSSTLRIQARTASSMACRKCDDVRC